MTCVLHLPCPFSSGPFTLEHRAQAPLSSQGHKVVAAVPIRSPVTLPGIGAPSFSAITGDHKPVRRRPRLFCTGVTMCF